MNHVPRLDGPRFGPANGGAPRHLVVLLHGWGADGNDLIGLAPPMSQLLPDAEFLSPHGPEACDANPMGRQWFPLSDMSPRTMRRGVESVAPRPCPRSGGTAARAAWPLRPR